MQRQQLEAKLKETEAKLKEAEAKLAKVREWIDTQRQGERQSWQEFSVPMVEVYELAQLVGSAPWV